jgi:monolysocardiolipin acyltransferase
MRYFKWGVARLILEAEPCPRVVPIWIEGLDNVMHESRSEPRFIPRIGKDVKVVFGEEVDAERVFGDLRMRWRDIVRKEEEDGRGLTVGVLTDRLKGAEEATELRIECARRVREEVLRVRRGAGWPDEPPENGVAETWKEEGDKREGKMKDGSWEKDT